MFENRIRQLGYITELGGAVSRDGYLCRSQNKLVKRQKINRKMLLRLFTLSDEEKYFFSAMASTKEEKESISPTFYEQPFSYQSVLLCFSVLTFCVKNSLAKGNW